MGSIITSATADHLLLVVDEAFVDCIPELSVAGAVRPGLLVVRSFGKFFGLAGLRLGFAIDPATADAVWKANGQSFLRRMSSRVCA